MEYAKQLLKKEKVSLQEFESYSQIFEMLSNQQELKNVIKKILFSLKDLEGAVTIFEIVNDKFELVGFNGSKEEVEQKIESKIILKKVKESKKPYFLNMAEEKFENYFMVLPILSKEEILGCLCIHTEQEIKNWKEIFLALQLMSFVFKYYDLIESNKNINTKDVVTELFNYRHFQDQLDLEIEKTTRYYVPLSLVMIDIKDFKLINEKLGYESGDAVLKQLASWIQKQCRRVDMPARLKDDTFAILLSNTSVEGAQVLLDRILFKINHLSMNIGGRELKIKVKTSITSFNPDYTKDQFIELAKENLK